eukprot:1327813-Pleurochrysis_carterae.AAC.1
MPHAIVLEIVGPSLSVVTPVAWSRCGAPKRPLQVDVRKARRVVAASARDTSTHAGSHSGGYFGYASEYNFGDGSVHSGVNGGVNGGNGTVAAVRKSPVRPLRAVYASTVPKVRNSASEIQEKLLVIWPSVISERRCCSLGTWRTLRKSCKVSHCVVAPPGIG